jgi:hypothetical protein
MPEAVYATYQRTLPYCTRVVPNFRRRHKCTARFLDDLLRVCGPVGIFGGAPRVWNRDGKMGHENDLDIVVDCDPNILADFLSVWRSHKGEPLTVVDRTYYGGWRLKKGGPMIDIWPARSTWGIREGKVEYKSLRSLLQTVFFTAEASLLVWPEAGKQRHGTYYGFDPRRHGLNIVLQDNPKPWRAAAGAVRVLHEGQGSYTGVTGRFTNAVQQIVDEYADRVIEELQGFGLDEQALICHGFL